MSFSNRSPRPPKSLEASTYLDYRLFYAPTGSWEAEVSPVLVALEAFLPSVELSLVPADRELTVSWASGPSPAQVRDVISGVLGAQPVSDTEGVLVTWQGIQVTFRRAALPAAQGFALLSAALGGPCPVCEDDFGAFEAALFAATDRPDPQLLSSHPNLAGLSALGLDLVFVERLAEVVGGLCVSGTEFLPTGFFHDRGHLPGLVDVARSLGAL